MIFNKDFLFKSLTLGFVYLNLWPTIAICVLSVPQNP